MTYNGLLTYLWLRLSAWCCGMNVMGERFDTHIGPEVDQ